MIIGHVIRAPAAQVGPGGDSLGAQGKKKREQFNCVDMFGEAREEKRKQKTQNASHRQDHMTLNTINSQRARLTHSSSTPFY